MERGLPFDRVTEFDFEAATFVHDLRRDYGEERWVGIGYCRGRLHFLCFATTPSGIRVISFRKANEREIRKHGKPKTID